MRAEGRDGGTTRSGSSGQGGGAERGEGKRPGSPAGDLLSIVGMAQVGWCPQDHSVCSPFSKLGGWELRGSWRSHAMQNAEQLHCCWNPGAHAPGPPVLSSLMIAHEQLFIVSSEPSPYFVPKKWRQSNSVPQCLGFNLALHFIPHGYCKDLLG